jgi:hypothetical protein
MERRGKWLYPVLTVEVEFRGILNVVTASATPTVALTADRPTNLSSLLALPSLTLPAPYPPAHISDTTNTSRL